jgi:hypothetical protein
METIVAGLIGTGTTLAFLWLWRKAKVERALAETRMIGAEKELATARKVATDLRVILAERNREINDLRKKLPPSDLLDEFFGLPKRDPGQDNH